MRCSITCMEPGCTNKIYYTVADAEKLLGFGMEVDAVTDLDVPLYCDKHRTKKGRHAATRLLR